MIAYSYSLPSVPPVEELGVVFQVPVEVEVDVDVDVSTLSISACCV
jgi:hypothetical protein